jgi:hypothetical protein
MQQTYLLVLNCTRVLGMPFFEYDKAEITAKDYIKRNPNAEITIVASMASLKLAENPFHIRRFV